MRLLLRLQAFLFSPISAQGFGLMRISWAGIVLLIFLAQWMDITHFYSEQGVLPFDYEKLVIRNVYRFTLLDFITDPAAVFALYLSFLLCLILTMLGPWPRLTMILSVVLMYSFNERNPLILGGGDTVLRLVGFLLCVAPTLRAFSLARLREQWQHWRTARTYLPSLTMPLWVYRLLLWQIIVLYTSSVWFKMLGTMWENGTAVTVALQLEPFIRWPHGVMAFVIFLAPFITLLTVAFEAVWVLLLFPRSFTRWLIGWEFQPHLKRWLLLAGVLFHGGIFLVMDVGSFSLAMLVAYTGLLLGEDFEAIRKWLNAHWFTNCFHLYKLKTNPSTPLRARNVKLIQVFYDGDCGLCLRSIFWLGILNNLHRLSFLNFRDEVLRLREAPEIALADLDRAMHVRFPDDTVLKGFDASRRLTWHLPALWVAAPFLYLPGVAPIGRRIYAKIAARRDRCRHEGCVL